MILQRVDQSRIRRLSCNRMFLHQIQQFACEASGKSRGKKSRGWWLNVRQISVRAPPRSELSDRREKGSRMERVRGIAASSDVEIVEGKWVRCD